MALLLCLSGPYPATAWTGDLLEAWLLRAEQQVRWMSGGGLPRSGGGPWCSVAQQRLGPAVRRDGLGLGWDRAGGGHFRWQQTRASQVSWSEQCLRGVWRLPWRWRSALLAVVRSTRVGDEVWPADVLVALRPEIEFLQTVRIDLRIDLWTRSRTWERWSRERWVRAEVYGAGGASVLDVVPTADGAPALCLQVMARPAAAASLGGIWDGRDRSLSLVLALRRRGLLIRSRHGVHPVLGPIHAWSVAWVGGR